MAIWQENGPLTLRSGTRSNNALRVSGHTAPAGEWIVDPSLPVLFEYPYGGAGQSAVVIAKGMAVSVTDPMNDPETGKKRCALTIADGSNPVVGVAPFNISQRVFDQLTGNVPVFITDEVIELPLLQTPEQAAQVKWGAVFGDIHAGDKLVPASGANKGQLRKYVKGTDDPDQIVGKVINMELDQTPGGWLEWAMWDASLRSQDGVPYIDYGQPTEQGYPYDPKIREGLYGTYSGYQSDWNTQGTGIPGLTAGDARNQTLWRSAFTVPANTAEGTKIQVQLQYKNLQEGSVQVYVGGVEQAANLYTVDHKNGLVTFTVPAALANQPADASGEITYKAYFYGTPPGWDWVGSVGAVHVLLSL